MNTNTTAQGIEFTRVSNDINGSPRYVCHFLNLLSNDEQNEISAKAKPFNAINDMYNEALLKAKKIGGKKFHNKKYGGGIVFQSYNINDTAKDVLSLLK